jgi:hypothetical protein
MYGYTYWATATITTGTAALDLLEINAPSDAVVILHEVAVEQSSETDSEALAFKIHRGSTSGSSGGSVTPSPVNVGAPAFGGTVESGNTTQGNEGAFIAAGGANSLNPGWYFQPPDEGKPVISPSGRIIIELETAPADAITIKVRALIEEIGG